MSNFHPAFMFLFVRRHLRSVCEALPERGSGTGAIGISTDNYRPKYTAPNTWISYQMLTNYNY